MQAAPKRHWNIAIAGCGPGGMAAAISLAQSGHAVTVFERFETPAPVGSGLLLQPAGQLVLDRMGLLNEITKLSAPVDRLFGLAMPSMKRALDVEYRHLGAGMHALGIHRASLFDVLFRGMQFCGVTMKNGHTLTGYRLLGDKIVPEFGAVPYDHHFDLLIDSTGSHSVIANAKPKLLPFGALWTTVDLPDRAEWGVGALDQRYRQARQMAGILPVGLNPATGKPGVALFWSIRPEDAPNFLAKGIDNFRRAFSALWPGSESYTDQISDCRELTLAVYHHRTDAPVAAPGVFRIGDAWHSTSPQLGQGANMALIDAEGLALAINASETVGQIATAYHRLRARHVRVYQLLSRIFTPAYQSESAALPVLRDFASHYLARLPVVRAIIAQTVSGRIGLR